MVLCLVLDGACVDQISGGHCLRLRLMRLRPTFLYRHYRSYYLTYPHTCINLMALHFHRWTVINHDYACLDFVYLRTIISQNGIIPIYT